jgi:hypothetical protein
VKPTLSSRRKTMEDQEVEKKPYTAPQLIFHGDVEVITLGSQCGNILDAAFPAGTNFANLTCTS